MNAVLAADLVNSSGSGDLAGMLEKTCGVARSLSGVLAGPFNMRIRVGIARTCRMSRRREMQRTMN